MSGPSPSKAGTTGPSLDSSFNANETWLLGAVFRHAPGGIKASDVNWDNVLAEPSCPYTSKGSVTVTFGKMKRKLESLRGANATEADGAAGTAPSTPRTPAKSGRKKKSDAVGVDGTPTSKVSKARKKPAASPVKREALEAALESAEAGTAADAAGASPSKKGPAKARAKGARGAKNSVKKETDESGGGTAAEGEGGVQDSVDAFVDGHGSMLPPPLPDSKDCF